jgi:hypothetical protein
MTNRHLESPHEKGPEKQLTDLKNAISKNPNEKKDEKDQQWKAEDERADVLQKTEEERLAFLQNMATSLEAQKNQAA